MKELPEDMGRRVRMGKLKAKLSKTKDPEQRAIIQEKMKAAEVLPSSSPLPEPPAPAPPVARPVTDSDLKEVIGAALEGVELSGFPIKRTELAMDSLSSGLTLLAKRKGWDVGQMGCYGLIGLGVGLIVLQSLPGWIALYRKKAAETPPEGDKPVEKI